MPIRNNLRRIMADQRIDNISDLMELTGLSRNALNKLWHDKDIESVKLETLTQLCDGLRIPLSELIEYRPRQKGR